MSRRALRLAAAVALAWLALARPADAAPRDRWFDLSRYSFCYKYRLFCHGYKFLGLGFNLMPDPAIPFERYSALGSAPHPLSPVRAYLRADHIPPTGIGAYGVMALRARPTPATAARLAMACTAFVKTLARQSSLPASVPLSDQMLTVWPLDAPLAPEAESDDCGFVLDHYDLYAADAAIRDATRQGQSFTGRGPFLIGWSPSTSRGVPDALVLVVDMSGFDSLASFETALLFWKEKVIEDPSLWRTGFSRERFRLSLRDFVDHYGDAILKAAHLSAGRSQ